MSDKKNESQEASIPVSLLAEALAKAMKEGQPTAGLITGMSEERLARAQGKYDKPKRYRIIPGKSPETEATFDMLVVESRTHKEGRVIQLNNYRHPKGMFQYQAVGGRCPDNLQMWQKEAHAPGQIIDEDAVPPGILSTHYKQWRWETFWQADLRRIAGGQPLRPYNCADAADMKKPWLDAKLPEQKTEAAAE